MATTRTTPQIKKLPPIEDALTAWLLADKTVTDAIGERLSDRIKVNQIAPFAILSRIGGGSFGDDATTDEAVLRVTTYATKRSDAFDAISAIRASLVASEDVEIAPGLKLQGVRVDSVISQPDPVSDHPRYVMTFVAWAILT